MSATYLARARGRFVEVYQSTGGDYSYYSGIQLNENAITAVVVGDEVHCTTESGMVYVYSVSGAYKTSIL
jgi:hypothetical protein